MVKHTQTIPQLLPTNCFSVFHHFVGLVLTASKYTLYPLTTNVPHHIETSQLICIAKSTDWFLYDGEH